MFYITECMNFSGRFFLSFRYSTEYLGETRTRPDNNMNCIIYKNGFYLNLFLNKPNCAWYSDNFFICVLAQIYTWRSRQRVHKSVFVSQGSDQIVSMLLWRRSHINRYACMYVLWLIHVSYDMNKQRIYTHTQNWDNNGHARCSHKTSCP